MADRRESKDNGVKVGTYVKDRQGVQEGGAGKEGHLRHATASHSRLGHPEKFLSKPRPIFSTSGGEACGKGTKASSCTSGWTSQHHTEENSLQINSNQWSPGSPEVGRPNQTRQEGFPEEVSCVEFGKERKSVPGGERITCKAQEVRERTVVLEVMGLGAERGLSPLFAVRRLNSGDGK